jgi:predicted nucleotidyltransferase
MSKREPSDLRKKLRMGEVVNRDLLNQVVTALNPARYAVIGGHAAMLYGSPRATVDVDLLLPSDEVRAIVDRARLDARVVSIGGVAARVEDVDVSLIHYNDPPWLEAALARTVTDDGVRYLARPYLVLLKMIASRDERDLLDVLAICRGLDDEGIRLSRELLHDHAAAEQDDFESILAYCHG